MLVSWGSDHCSKRAPCGFDTAEGRDEAAATAQGTRKGDCTGLGAGKPAEMGNREVMNQGVGQRRPGCPPSQEPAPQPSGPLAPELP